MEVLGVILVFLGASIGALFTIILLCRAFQQSFVWGFGCLLVPFMLFVFVMLNWEDTRKPFLLSLLAIPITVVGAILAGYGMPIEPAP
jgi:hypothetical protein